MENPKDYCYDIDVGALSVGGAVALLGLGYLTLLRMYYAGIESLVTSAGASQIVGRVVGLSMLDCGPWRTRSVISSALWSRFESLASWCFRSKVLNGMRAMFGGHDVR